jgi:hypothetical protein
MAKQPRTAVCRYCAASIIKSKVPGRIGGRLWRWATGLGSFYCPQAGGECWHEPEDA